MKNSSSLYILKPILTFLIGLILVLSCSQEETNPDLPVGVPGPNGSEAVVKLLIKGEAILPPSTRNMSEQTEGSYQDELQLLILEKQADDNTYIYNCHRPVEGTQGNFTVKVPNSLDGKELKFLLFSNSKDIIGDPDQKFVVTDGTNKNEDYIRTALLLTVNTKWDSSKNIPMWAEDSFTFRVPTPGAAATPVATLKLMRMLARVDVGLNYNGKELNSTAQELTNFKLQKIKVYHSKDKGQLMPNTAAYETTGTGADKVITIKTPSIPADGKIITPYEITVPDGSHASERDVYLFEQDMNLSQADFDVNRTCILVQGEYTAPAPAAGGTGTTYTGWYRLDFRDFGSDKGYADILRNKLYRFNITAVKGSGFATESDALNSVSSNITVELLAMDLNQNDIIFDGQSFLSVSGSELYFYQDRNTAGFSLTTNYGNGWKIETNGNGITATPAEGAMGSSVVDLTWNPLPTGAEQKEIYLTAGNLKKKLILKYVHETAPGDLTNFTLDPPFLYFVKDGGVGKINVTSNITKKYLSPTLGNLDFTIPSVIETTSFDVTVQPFNQSSSEPVEQGTVNVYIQAANAEVTGKSSINQLTYDKDLDCAPDPMGHGLENKNTPALLDVTYRTGEEAGTYLISFVPTDGGVASGPIPSNPVNGVGTVKVSASHNKGSKEREVGKLVFAPALNGKEISLIGHTLKKVPVIQSPAPVPVASIRPTGNITDLAWDQPNHSFTVEVDNVNFVETNEVSITTLPKSKMIDMTVPSSGTLGQPVTFTLNPNRGGAPKSRTVKVSVNGYGDHVGEEQVTFTQQAPDAPDPNKEPVLAATPGNSLPWDATEATLNLTNLDKIFEVQAGKAGVDASKPLDVTLPAEGFNLTPDKSSASMKVTFPKNDIEEERKVKVIATAIGNRESVKKVKEITLTQKGVKKGSIEFVNSTHPLLESEVAKGDIHYNFANIDPKSIKVQGGANWINFVVQDPTNYKYVSFAATKNTGTTRRSVTFKMTATDLIGRPVETTAAMTLTQAGSPMLDIPTKNLRLGHLENAQGSLQLQLANVQESTLRVSSKPNWIKSATIVGQQIKLVASANSGDSPERTGTLTVEAQDEFGKQISSSVEVKQNANVVLVNNTEIRFDGVSGDKMYHKLININSGSRRLKSARVKTPMGQNDAIYVDVASTNSSGANFSFEVKGNLNDYNELTREVEVEWTSPEDVVTTSRIKIIRSGHPQPTFRINSGNLPGEIKLDGGRTYDYTFSVTTGNLKSKSDGVQVQWELNGDSYLTIKDFQVLGPNNNEVWGYPTNSTVTIRIRFRVEDGVGYRPVGRIDIIGAGVDNVYKLLHRVKLW